MICTTCRVNEVKPINDRYCSFTCEECKISSLADTYATAYTKRLIEEDGKAQPDNPPVETNTKSDWSYKEDA